MMRLLMAFSRLLTGAVFVFSAVVKGVDPLGTAYKLEDYFAAYGTTWANDFALFFSILLCALEFVIGIALIFSLRMKITSWALLLIMVFFTGLTLYDAIYAPVPDCGCFGDAIKLTNWETFYKNVVLMVFVLIVFFNRTAFRPLFTHRAQNMALLLFTVMFVGFSVYNYRHLPMLDFRPWKVNNRMTPDPAAETRVYVKYVNTATGEIREYLSPDFPWNDPQWLAEWEFLDQRTETDSKHIVHGLIAEDEAGNDFTSYLLDSEATFVIVSHDIAHASARGKRKAVRLIERLQQDGKHVVLLTGSLPEDVVAFREASGVVTEAFFADGTTLKTMIRSNPGLVLFHKGHVAGKWHFNDFPDIKGIGKAINNLDRFDQPQP